MDDEAVQSNRKLLTNISIEDKRPRMREAEGLLLESLHKNTGLETGIQLITMCSSASATKNYAISSNIMIFTTKGSLTAWGKHYSVTLSL